MIIGGGLIVLLFFLTTYKQVAYISFGYGDFKVDIKWEEIDSYEKISELPKGIILGPEFDIEEVLYGDFTNNGKQNVAIYLWKKGNYGDALPFWVDENDNSYKQHLFIFEETGPDTYKSVWNSSNLPYINMKTYLANLDGDNKNEIIVLEKPYNKAHKTVAMWQWDDWGFKNIWRSESGNFSDLKLQ